jgi:hypothetical protein
MGSDQLSQADEDHRLVFLSIDELANSAEKLTFDPVGSPAHE